MAYEANRDKDAEKARNDANNAQNVRNAADVAIATGNPYAAAAGVAVKGADKLTGGKASEALGKGISAVNNVSPLGKKTQDLSNKVNESGLGDTVGKAASFKNATNGGADVNFPSKGGNEVKPPTTVANNGGGQNSSLPSSSSDKTPKKNRVLDDSDDKKNKDDDSNEEKKNSKGFGSFFGKQLIITVVLSALPILIVLMIMILIIGSITGVFSDFEDAFGMSEVLGEETGDLYITPASKEQKEFYDRINKVKNDFEADGKMLDAMKIIAVYHMLSSNNSKIEYKTVKESTIRSWANAMFNGDAYDEEYFKNNLINGIIPKYLPGKSKKQREELADEVFDYLDRYYNLIGKEVTHACSSAGACSYNIKGFYIPRRGNVNEDLNISNLYVRLMQCGSGSNYNYGGTFGQPLAGEELIPFEQYILGVAYMEIGASAPAEAIKAQLVAARSYILARHVDMGGWRTLKKEADGRWVIQVAACNLDQVFCNPELGCSYDSGRQVHSGKIENPTLYRAPLAQNAPLRTYASEVEGELLVNEQGYVVYSGYKQAEQNKFVALANKGLNYKQILMQVYNSGSRNIGASDIQKSNCKSTSASNCISTGEYSKWRQYDSQWGNVPMGNSGQNIRQIGCLVTSVAMLIAKSGVAVDPSIKNFNPGTFVQFLNSHGGFASGGNFVWAMATKAAPTFVYQGQVALSGMSRQQKLNKIKEITSQPGVYAVAEVKGNTGQHWVAIDGVIGNTVNMMDPASDNNDMWGQYNWNNTSVIVYYKVRS